jgi:hypothetical protein
MMRTASVAYAELSILHEANEERLRLPTGRTVGSAGRSVFTPIRVPSVKEFPGKFVGSALPPSLFPKVGVFVLKFGDPFL